MDDRKWGGITIVGCDPQPGVPAEDYDLRGTLDSDSFSESLRVGSIPPGYIVRRRNGIVLYRVVGEYGKQTRLVTI